MNKLTEGLVIGAVLTSVLNQQRTPQEQIDFEDEVKRLRNRTSEQIAADQAAEDSKNKVLAWVGLVIGCFIPLIQIVCIPVLTYLTVRAAYRAIKAECVKTWRQLIG